MSNAIAWTPGLLAGGFALAGVASQHLFARRADRDKHRREQRDLAHHNEHDAFVAVVKAGRKVQRALRDMTRHDRKSHLAYRAAVVDLAECVAVVRLVAADLAVLSAAKRFEEQAKDADTSSPHPMEARLRLTELIDAMRAYEARFRE